VNYSYKVLVLDLDYLLDLEVYFKHDWTPFPRGERGVGRLSPPQLSLGGSS